MKELKYPFEMTNRPKLAFYKESGEPWTHNERILVKTFTLVMNNLINEEIENTIESQTFDKEMGSDVSGFIGKMKSLEDYKKSFEVSKEIIEYDETYKRVRGSSISDNFICKERIEGFICSLLDIEEMSLKIARQYNLDIIEALSLIILANQILSLRYEIEYSLDKTITLKENLADIDECYEIMEDHLSRKIITSEEYSTMYFDKLSEQEDKSPKLIDLLEFVKKALESGYGVKSSFLESDTQKENCWKFFNEKIDF